MKRRKMTVLKSTTCKLPHRDPKIKYIINRCPLAHVPALLKNVPYGNKLKNLITQFQILPLSQPDLKPGPGARADR